MTTEAMRVSAETATVYRGPRRRFLTQQAAYRDAAKALIMEHCECEAPEEETHYRGYTCHHHEEVHFQRLVPRLARWLKRIDAARSLTPEAVQNG